MSELGDTTNPNSSNKFRLDMDATRIALNLLSLADSLAEASSSGSNSDSRSDSSHETSTASNVSETQRDDTRAFGQPRYSSFKFDQHRQSMTAIDTTSNTSTSDNTNPDGPQDTIKSLLLPNAGKCVLSLNNSQANTKNNVHTNHRPLANYHSALLNHNHNNHELQPSIATTTNNNIQQPKPHPQMLIHATSNGLQPQKIIQCGPVVIERNTRMARSTKCLVGVIGSLVLVILALVALDRLDFRSTKHRHEALDQQLHQPDPQTRRGTKLDLTPPNPDVQTLASTGVAAGSGNLGSFNRIVAASTERHETAVETSSASSSTRGAFDGAEAPAGSQSPLEVESDSHHGGDHNDDHSGDHNGDLGDHQSDHSDHQNDHGDHQNDHGEPEPEAETHDHAHNSDHSDDDDHSSEPPPSRARSSTAPTSGDDPTTTTTSTRRPQDPSSYSSHQTTSGRLAMTTPMPTTTRGVDLAEQSQGLRNNPSTSVPSSSSNSGEGVCMTHGCVKAAAQIINHMDNSTDPCDDFYQFACGNWIKTQVIPDEKTSLSMFTQSTYELTLKLRALIENNPSRAPAMAQQVATGQPEPPIVGQLRNLYLSCMNTSDIEARGDEPLLAVLRDLGGWPVRSGAPPPLATASAAARSNRPLAMSRGNRQAARNHAQPLGFTTVTRNRMVNVPVSASASGNRTWRGRAAAAAVSRSRRSSAPPPYWMELLFKFKRHGFSQDTLIDLSVVVDIKNNKRYVIELDQSSLGLPDRSYYFKGANDTTVAAYMRMWVEAATMLGASRQEATKLMQEAFEFETALAKISLPREARRNVTSMYNKVLARDLHKLAPNIDWQLYLTTLLGDIKPPLDVDTDEVVVKVPSFLTAIDELLMTTEPRIVSNYLIWRVVRNSMSSLGRKWRELAHSYSMVTTGKVIEEPRWEVCLGTLDGTLDTALSALYVKHHFNKHSKVVALQMVDYIRDEFLRILQEIDWMDAETKREALQKAKAIQSFIGYPEELLQDHLVEGVYSGISMSRTNFFANLRHLRSWSTDYAFSKLRQPNKRGDWTKHSKSAVVNAYYNSLENSIEFPAGILQGVFFDAERPNYLNFGGIGYVIGHEITHGFDDRGRQYDKDGQDRNWWKPETDANFRERAQCIIEQYGNFTVKENGLKVNALNTQGENIADNGGIKQAFRAYRRWTRDHGPEARLPGLNYSPDQLFWLSAANVWCGKFRPEVLRLRVNSGVHSPARFRIVGPLSNSIEFAQSFKCPVGSAMNPRKKCSVW